MGIFDFRKKDSIARIYGKIEPYTVNVYDDGGAEINLYGEIVEHHPIDYWTGEKVEGLFIALDEFLETLDYLGDVSRVRFNINSVGGSVNAGVTIFNKIREMSQNGVETITRVEGAADSAAALVMQAANTREVAVGAEVMIHDASCLVCDYCNAKQLGEYKDMLESADNRIAQLLAESSGRNVREIKHMMDKTTWMTAYEAVENGFADEIVNQKVTVEKIKGKSKMLMINGIPHIFRAGIPKEWQIGETTNDKTGRQNDIRKMRLRQTPEEKNGNEPDNIENETYKTEHKTNNIENETNKTGHKTDNIENEAYKAKQKSDNTGNEADKTKYKPGNITDMAAGTENNGFTNNGLQGEKPLSKEGSMPGNKKEVQAMTVEELRAQYPDLVKQIEAEARKAGESGERQRIKDIEAIEDMAADPEAVRAAKYENPIDAKTLAFNIMSKNVREAGEFMSARQAEINDSGITGISALPVNASEAHAKDKEIKDGANAIAKSFIK